MPAQSKMNVLLKSILPILALSLMACGTDEKTGGTAPARTEQVADGVTPALADVCHESSCSTGQYCFEAFDGDLKFVTGACQPIPEGCEDDHECMKKDARNVFKTERHCVGAWVTSVKMDSGLYKVSCAKY